MLDKEKEKQPRHPIVVTRTERTKKRENDKTTTSTKKTAAMEKIDRKRTIRRADTADDRNESCFCFLRSLFFAMDMCLANRCLHSSSFSFTLTVLRDGAKRLFVLLAAFVEIRFLFFLFSFLVAWPTASIVINFGVVFFESPFLE